MRTRQLAVILSVFSVAIVGGLAVASLVLANAPPPDPRPEPPPSPPGVPVVLALQGEGEPLRIEVPRAMLEGGDGSAAAASKERGIPFFGFGTIGTIIGGAALSLAVVLGGLWAAGRLKQSSPARHAVKAAALLVAVGALGSAVGVAWADIAVDPPPRNPATRADMTGRLVVVARGDAIKIHISPSQARRFAALARRGRGAGSAEPGDGAAPPDTAPGSAPSTQAPPPSKPSK